MKPTSPFPLLTLTLAAAVHGDDTPRQEGPFTLRITDSINAALNGGALASCHAGAAIEALCYPTGSDTARATGDASAQYYFNTTAGAASGILIWNLPSGGSGTAVTPSTVRLEARAESELATALIYPGAAGATAFEFDAAGKLLVRAPYDEARFGVFERPAPAFVPLYRWEACWNFAGGYYYPTVNWALGAGRPRNPTCVSVNITRV